MEKIYAHNEEEEANGEQRRVGSQVIDLGSQVIDLKKFREAQEINNLNQLKEELRNLWSLVDINLICDGLIEGNISKEYLLDYMNRKLLIVWRCVNGVQFVVVPGFIKDYKKRNPNTPSGKPLLSTIDPLDENEIIINKIRNELGFKKLNISFWKKE
jgi:hypothetical protein